MNRTSALSMDEPHLNTVRVHFDNLLVALDLAPSSANTLKIAVELGQRSGSRLVVAYVLDPALMMPSGTTVALRENIERWLEPYLKEGIRFSVEVVEGNLVHEITHLAAKYRADLLLVGSRGPAEVGRLIFGSKAESLFR